MTCPFSTESTSFCPSVPCLCVYGAHALSQGEQVLVFSLCAFDQDYLAHWEVGPCECLRVRCACVHVCTSVYLCMSLLCMLVKQAPLHICIPRLLNMISMDVY
jgi:hypothetical protein